MQVYLLVTIEDGKVTANVDVTTIPRAYQAEMPTGMDPDTLRLGLRISERVADFADQVRNG